MVCEPARLAVGFRHRTWVSRPAGAASRLLPLQTPPSTYSRPAISTGANSHGDAAGGGDRLGRACPRRARAAEHDALAVPPVDGDDAQASVEARAGGRDVRLEMLERRRRPGETAQHRRAEHGATGRRDPERERSERRSRGERPTTRPAAPPPGRQRRASSPAGDAPARSRCRSRSVVVAAPRRRGVRRRSHRRTCRRTTRSGAGQSRWRLRPQRGRPSSTPHRGPRRRRGRGHRGAKALTPAG